ncbi:redoxin domain-containing protein [Chachezhania antarctica]|uniref:redoxin domain-containing protein n=1 Tax=Chachezhania antarctica TaxID=2340860 RepID=UPI000EB39E35|nr:redoxin domain-containing protein [Chachezhania antarctica]
MLVPSQPVPALTVETLAGGPFDLARDKGEKGTLVIFYRGLHCPICIRQMTEIEGHLEAFTEAGIEVIMISGDDEAKARETIEKAGTSKLRVGYGMDLISARDDWGLLISKAREGTAEAPYFFEPGHFYVSEDNRLYYGWQQTAPFSRPKPEDMLRGITFRIEKDYPPRGMYTDRLPGEG